MLTVAGLRKNFGPIHAVRDISFALAKGDVLGFLGPNGAGKSTTMRMITGYLHPTEGTATVNGYDIREQSVCARRQLGYLPENAPVYRDATVYHFLKFIAEIRGLRGRKRRQQLERIMDVCQLESVRHQPVETLSKGFRQRVCFAQAILHDPPVLIMDEPTDGLDPNQKAIVRRMILNMAETKAIVISTHILEEVDAVCNRAIIISDGRIVAEGTPDELKRLSPAHGAVVMELKEQSENVASELETLPAAKRVKRMDGNRYMVYPRQPDTLCQEILDQARRRAWNLRSLSVQEGRLDETFHRFTRIGGNAA